MSKCTVAFQFQQAGSSRGLGVRA